MCTFEYFLWITFNILSMSASLGMNFCTSLPVLTRLSNSWGSWKKWFIWSLVCFWYYTILEWTVFFRIGIEFWVNVHISWNFLHRNFYWLRWGSVNMIRKEKNVFAHFLHHSSVNDFHTRITYWLHRGCKIGYIYDFLFYFWHLRKFLQVFLLIEKLVD